MPPSEPAQDQIYNLQVPGPILQFVLNVLRTTALPWELTNPAIQCLFSQAQLQEAERKPTPGPDSVI